MILKPRETSEYYFDIYKKNNMKKYTSEELAAYAKAFALQKFNSADEIYDKFKGDLNHRMKRVQLTLPMEDELERQSRRLAEKSLEMLGSIREEAVERRLSNGLKNEAWHPGIDLAEHEVYFDDMAISMMKDAIAEAHRPLAEEFSAWKKRQRKR
ncbi:hypothetical protein KXD93_05100 [Mucilaginibacter sp. BJC16-A38]|uniref:hypothetical protein n=1 Tax=Mucilaginibacter phenanthrenivorans TaxID=1234842 RepID=UPI0021585618|nr:hypothetical protein [Mucilaginibacter phenanthrenivorans]MCR8557005.1 hypothetical protein [Mucilaginibacter phenanthrenivorans]